MNAPFTLWTKVSSVVGGHATLEYHRPRPSVAEEFKRTQENPKKTVAGQFNKEMVELATQNRVMMECITRTILFLGKQCLALRGKGEDPKWGSNSGKFLNLFNLMAENDPTLRQQLEAPLEKNTTYLSPRSQNEVINLIGKDFIQNKLLSEVKAARYYSVLADEVASHNVEQMPICIRPVDNDLDIREEFLEFVRLERVTGHAIATAILQTLEEYQLPLQDMRGRYYDGASSMSSNRVGVQTICETISTSSCLQPLQ